MIAQGATPTLLLKICGYDLTDADNAVATIKTQNAAVNFGMDRMTIASGDGGSVLAIHLTQEESLAMAPTEAYVQVRFELHGECYTTEIAYEDIGAALYKGVI